MMDMARSMPWMNKGWSNPHIREAGASDALELIGISRLGVDDAVRLAVEQFSGDPEAPLELRVDDLRVKRVAGELEFRAVLHILVAQQPPRAALGAERSADSPFANAPPFDPSRIRPLPPD